ncbi:MAG: YciI family protein [Saprospiraceae bacterium]
MTMQEFMILIREDLEKLAQLSPEQMEADIQLVTDWIGQLAQKGQFLGGHPLHSLGKTVRANTITDGPYLELKEGVSGYLLLQAQDMDEAVQIASTFPTLFRGDALEIRPLMKLPGA